LAQGKFYILECLTLDVVVSGEDVEITICTS